MASRADGGPGASGRADPPVAAGIADVARRAGVSTATVSRALRGVGAVREDTRARVLRAAEELAYTASPTAASLVTGRTGVVAVLAPFVSRWFFAHVLGGVERALRPAGLHVLLVAVGDDPRGRQLAVDLRRLRRRVDALLVLSCDLHADEVALVEQLGIPVVTVGVDVPPWDLVGIDDAAAGETAMRHLLGLGHTRIGYVGGDSERDVHIATAVERGSGLRRALRAARLPRRALVEVVGDWTIAGGRRAGHELLCRADRPTAVLAASDEMAVGVLLAARDLGLRVPVDLSVVGVDDHEMAVTHGLTTVAQPVDGLGEAAADLLVDALRPGARGRRERCVVRLPTELLVRGTTGAPQDGRDCPKARASAASLLGGSA